MKKTRYLYMVGQTRVHCDSVQGLGDFMELEVMMKEGQSNEEGVAIAEDLVFTFILLKMALWCQIGNLLFPPRCPSWAWTRMTSSRAPTWISSWRRRRKRTEIKSSFN